MLAIINYVGGFGSLSLTRSARLGFGLRPCVLVKTTDTGVRQKQKYKKGTEALVLVRESFPNTSLFLFLSHRHLLRE
jgi:hypothetical protein